MASRAVLRWLWLAASLTLRPLRSTYKFCSPSRSSLMTGRFPQHVNMHNLALSVPGAGIPLGMTTIASKLKTAGYATHAVVRAQQHPAPGPSHRRHVLSDTSERCSQGKWHWRAPLPRSPRAPIGQPHPISPGWTVNVGSGMATPAQTPTGKGFDSYLGYFDGFNDYLHSWSGEPGPLRPSALARLLTSLGPRRTAQRPSLSLGR